jgi:hypothetical protein
MAGIPPEARIVLIILALWVVACVLAVSGAITLPAPPTWFDAWSRLIAAVAATAIAARVLWAVPRQLKDFLDGIRDLRQKQS